MQAEAKANTVKSEYRVISRPSDVIKRAQTTLSIDGVSYDLEMIHMKRSLLLVINNSDSRLRVSPGEDGDSPKMSHGEMMSHFKETNESLKGLSLGIGEHNTCLIHSENSLASANLASRISKKLNLSCPVYVANNMRITHNTIDPGDMLSRVHMKIFQFVTSNYTPTQNVVN